MRGAVRRNREHPQDKIPNRPHPPNELEINIGEELDTLQTLKTQGLPVKHKGFTFNGDKIDFDSNTKELDGVTYTGRFKTGGTGNSQGNNGVSFNAKKDDTLTVLAMSASTSGTGRHLMVAPVGGVGYNLGEVHTTQLEAFTYKIPADGQYVLYSDNGGINIYYISVFTNPPTSEKTLTTAVEGEGEIDLDPPGGSYDVGTVVTLEAKPADG